MIVVDLNLVSYALNQDAPEHEVARSWWEDRLSETRPVGLAWSVLLGFLRVATHPRVVPRPLSATQALQVVDGWLALPQVRLLEPTDRHWHILRELMALTARVASRLRADGYRARTVTLKARLATFTTLTRSKTMADPTDVGADLYQTVAALYRALPGERRRIRLLGVQATGLLSAGAEQLALLHGERWSDVERTIDRIEERFGRGAAQPASLLDRDRRH